MAFPMCPMYRKHDIHPKLHRKGPCESRSSTRHRFLWLWQVLGSWGVVAGHALQRLQHKSCIRKLGRWGYGNICDDRHLRTKGSSWNRPVGREVTNFELGKVMKEKQLRKVIHVHLINGHKNYYFGSVSAVYRKFTAKELGCSEKYLGHVLTEDGMHHITPKALIIRSRLMTWVRNGFKKAALGFTCFWDK